MILEVGKNKYKVGTDEESQKIKDEVFTIIEDWLLKAEETNTEKELIMKLIAINNLSLLTLQNLLKKVGENEIVNYINAEKIN